MILAYFFAFKSGDGPVQVGPNGDPVGGSGNVF